MGTLQTKVLTWAASLCLLFGIGIAPAVGQAQTGTTDDQTAASTTKT